MKSLSRLSCTLAAILFMIPGLTCATVMDRTLATVNGQAILLSEFEKNATPILEQFRKATPPAEQTPDRVADIKKRVLDQMIDDRLLVQEAKKNNVHVSQLETDEGVKKVRTRFTTEAEFNGELKKEGMTYEEFRTHIQDQLSTIKLIDQEVKSKTTQPSDAEIKQLYDTLKDVTQDKPLPSGYTASDIDELKSLSRAAQHRFSEQVRARHILIRVAADASDGDRKAALAKIKDIQAQLKKGADFSELAKKYSEDPGSKPHGGDLGNFSHGDMVPAFEKAAFSLNVGQVSDIVTTDYGYHLIKVEEKKASTAMTFDDIKDDLKDYLYQKRGAKRFEEYVKNLRAKADIKINNLS